MGTEEVIEFLRENGHTITLWVNAEGLWQALRVMVASEQHIKSLNNFYGIDVIDVYWKYSQLHDDDQAYIAAYSNAKYRCIMAMSRKRS